MTPRLSRAAFGKSRERVLSGALGPPIAKDDQPNQVDIDASQESQRETPFPTAADAASALKTLCEELTRRVPGYAAVMMPLLSAALRGCYLLLPGFPTDDIPLALRGFPVNPPRTLGELNDLLSRIEDILLLELPLEQTPPGHSEHARGKTR
jgi:hypothetical protein